MYGKKTLIVLLILFVLGMNPTAAFANSTEEARKQLLLQQIEILQKQLAALIKLKAELPDPQLLANLDIYESRFHQGDYHSLYNVEDGQLERRDGHVVRQDDQLLWEAYVDMVGEDFVNEYISEFRVINDEDNILTGFVDQKFDASWILAVNKFGKDFSTTKNSDFIVELLLHETAHIPFFANQQYEKDFSESFWDSSATQRHEGNLAAAKNLDEKSEIAKSYYEDNQDKFVSDYAATSPTEDLVESFVEFVISDKPTGNRLKDEKIRFFYDYPDMVDWRSELRQSELIKSQL